MPDMLTGADSQTIVRAETDADAAAIRQVNERAFDRPNEADLVEALRQSPAYIPQLALVAESDGKVVGHILLTEMDVKNEKDYSIALALGPVAVLPEYQRHGFGSHLIKAAIEIARDLSYPAIILIGHPEYYPRFGFAPARALGLRTTYKVPDQVFMVLHLGAECVKGDVIYHEAFAKCD
jgi:putative acetyltransferase